MTQKEKDRIIKANMALGMTRQEAEKVLEDDLKIDKGERLEWEPTIEEEKAMRKATKLVVPREKKKTATKREKKADETKQAIISLITETLKGNYENVEVPNAETQIDFVINGENFTVKLTKHRAPKE